MSTDELRDSKHRNGSAIWNRIDDTTMLWHELEITFGTRNAQEIVHRLRLLRAAVGEVAKTGTPVTENEILRGMRTYRQS